MSVNTIAHGESLPPLLQGESILTAGYTTDIELRVPATIHGPKRSETARGRVWVTTERVVFIALESGPSNYDAPPTLSSLVVPYSTLREATFNLPLFAPNHLLLTFLPDPTCLISGLPSPGRGGHIEAKLVIGEGAAHSVWKRIEGERGVWAARRRDEDTLPVYTPN